jgi:hypothetical protein
LGLHGSISNIPAEQVQWSETWENDDCLLVACPRNHSVEDLTAALQTEARFDQTQISTRTPLT